MTLQYLVTELEPKLVNTLVGTMEPGAPCSMIRARHAELLGTGRCAMGPSFWGRARSPPRRVALGLCHSRSLPHRTAPGTVTSSDPGPASARLGGPDSLKPQGPYEVGAPPSPFPRQDTEALAGRAQN